MQFCCSFSNRIENNLMCHTFLELHIRLSLTENQIKSNQTFMFNRMAFFSSTWPLNKKPFYWNMLDFLVAVEEINSMYTCSRWPIYTFFLFFVFLSQIFSTCVYLRTYLSIYFSSTSPWVHKKRPFDCKLYWPKISTEIIYPRSPCTGNAHRL